MSRRLLISLVTLILLVGGTYAAIQFAKGYRPDFKAREIQGTGLLVTNSIPEGAQVLIDGKLTTATDDTVNLPPGKYEVEIKKDGYIPWKKTLIIEAELVTQANARLFPAVTDLDPLTFTGAASLTPSPDGQKIVYAVSESSQETRKGLWILDLAERPLSLSKEPRQFVQNSQNLDFTTAILGWSPDSNQILAHFAPKGLRTPALEQNVLLDTSQMNHTDSIRDVTAQLPLLFSQWEQQLTRKLNDQLLDLPKEMQTIATSSATNLYFSPDGEKLLYTATRAVAIPESLIPSLPSSSTQTEERQLKPDGIYVYDLKEDKNYLIAEAVRPAEFGEAPRQETLVERVSPRTLFAAQEASPSAFTKLQKETTAASILAFSAQFTPLPVQQIMWYPDSVHLILKQDNEISILEYDGTNRSVVYVGSFEDGFVYPWPDGSKLLILANLNPTSTLPPNIYAINLK